MIQNCRYRIPLWPGNLIFRKIYLVIHIKYVKTIFIIFILGLNLRNNLKCTETLSHQFSEWCTLEFMASQWKCWLFVKWGRLSMLFCLGMELTWKFQFIWFYWFLSFEGFKWILCFWHILKLYPSITKKEENSQNS
jgi:hypothetical protein